ncbi:hypothetical protein ACKKBG_A24570 [Auxenochlorella protothecoides x Auxenochlorella symbiontica]
MATSKDAAKAPKPALSSKLMGLKFMQRAAHKEAVQNAATESSQPSEDAHWVKANAAQRCVVVFGGDPPLSQRGHNRVSFGGQNTAVEAEARRSSAKAATGVREEAVDDAGATVSDADLASRLEELQSVKTERSDGAARRAEVKQEVGQKRSRPR